MIAGNKMEEGAYAGIPFKTHFPGYINDDRKLSLHYQASELFVSSSLQDAGPMMVNESIMCGTPVVAFNLGVSEDLVINGITGYILPLGNTNEMASKMEILIRKERNPAFNDNIAKIGWERTSYAAFSADPFLQ
jgi:glycosyltransferase involved in cell wall biosynthesis